MGTIASELKAEREKRNIPLAHIAAETRISLRHLESLEEGRFSDMPGGIYNRAFLKAYCEILNLNVPEILQHYDNELALSSAKSSKPRAHKPVHDRSVNFVRIFVWGLVLVISGVGINFSRKWITTVFFPYFSHTQAADVPPEAAKSTPEPKPLETVTPSLPSVDLEASSQSTTAAALSLPVAASSSLTPVSEVSMSQAQPTGPSTEPQTIRLEVIATEKSWVSIERDGAAAFRKNMEPGEIQSFDASEKFLIIVGNAGGVNLKLNGKPAKPLGRQGSVVRILIDQGNLQDFLDQAAG
jgi:cytoskeleton protein RodZ